MANIDVGNAEAAATRQKAGHDEYQRCGKDRPFEPSGEQRVGKKQSANNGDGCKVDRISPESSL